MPETFYYHAQIRKTAEGKKQFRPYILDGKNYNPSKGILALPKEIKNLKKATEEEMDEIFKNSVVVDPNAAEKEEAIKGFGKEIAELKKALKEAKNAQEKESIVSEIEGLKIHIKDLKS